MAELEPILNDLRDHDGVEHVLLIGRDGLLIQSRGGDGLDAETVAAMVPGLLSAATAVGEAAGSGELATAALEWSGGVGLLANVSEDSLLVVLLRADVGFARLLRTIRECRAHLAELV